MSKSRCLCFKAINRLYGRTDDIVNYIKELEQQNEELMKIIEDDYQYFALKNNPETGRAKFLKTVINKYKNE